MSTDGNEDRRAKAAEVVHFTSADAPGPGATWSVYSEEYATLGGGDLIEGSERHVSTHATEAEADAEANRLSAECHR